MRNSKSTLQQTAQKLTRNQIIAELKAKSLKGGSSNACPPPFETGG